MNRRTAYFRGQVVGIVSSATLQEQTLEDKKRKPSEGRGKSKGSQKCSLRSPDNDQLHLEPEEKAHGQKEIKKPRWVKLLRIDEVKTLFCF